MRHFCSCANGILHFVYQKYAFAFVARQKQFARLSFLTLSALLCSASRLATVRATFAKDLQNRKLFDMLEFCAV